MSSLKSHVDAYDADDWQLVLSEWPYEGTKFQTDLVCAELARRAGPSPTAAAVRISLYIPSRRPFLFFFASPSEAVGSVRFFAESNGRVCVS